MICLPERFSKCAYAGCSGIAGLLPRGNGVTPFLAQIYLRSVECNLTPSLVSALKPLLSGCLRISDWLREAIGYPLGCHRKTESYRTANGYPFSTR